MQSIMEGVVLTVLGMGIVFIFLVVIIGWIEFSAKLSLLLSKHFPKFFDTSHLDPAPRQSQKKKKTATEAGTGAPIAAISAAIHKYRQKR
jgi:sodium pump decarboxylase gamma subunit